MIFIYVFIVGFIISFSFFVDIPLLLALVFVLVRRKHMPPKTTYMMGAKWSVTS